MTAPVPAPAAPSPRRRLWLFRLAAVAFGLSLFVLAELICVAFDWGRPTDYDDPFAGFSAVHPLFVLDEAGENYVIPRSRLKFFAKESFPAKKPPNGFRIFCLGGSTVQGRPFSKETSFTTWLELALKAADPSRDWDVVNCGGISYASYRLVPILEECLRYEPDLIIFCEGHNEFLEDRTYDYLKTAPAWIAAPRRFLSKRRLFVLLREALLHSSKKPAIAANDARPVLNDEVDAMLDHQGGLDAYHRDETWRQGVVAHFDHNIRRSIQIARSAGVPILLILPPSNLSDCPPFKSEHRAGLTAEEFAQWDALVAEAATYYRTAPDKAAELLEQALAIDDQYADTWFELGSCHESLSRWDDARAAYRRARDLDVCPLRIIQPLQDVLREVAQETNVPLIDAHALLEKDCPHQILGDYLLIDHVHPSFTGHQRIATAIAEEFAREGIVTLPPDWQTKREAAYRDHFAALDPLYFHRGQRTMESVRRWTQGKAKGSPLERRGHGGSD